MLIEMSQERMKEVGKVSFATFNAARSSRLLSVQQLLDEGIIPTRQKLYTV